MGNLFGYLHPVDAQKPSARLEKGFDALCVSTFTFILHALVCEYFIVRGATTSRVVGAVIIIPS